MSDTLETDKEQSRIYGDVASYPSASAMLPPLVEFARKLERQRNELLEALEQLIPGAEAMGWNIDQAKSAIAKVKEVK